MSKSVVIFLTGGIPECEFDPLAVHLDIRHVVFKDGGHVDLQ
jgi:hypothetical protein